MTRCFQNEAKNAPPWNHLKPADDDGDIAIVLEDPDEHYDEGPEINHEEMERTLAAVDNTNPKEKEDAGPTTGDKIRYPITETNSPETELKENNAVIEDTPKEVELIKKDKLTVNL